MIEYLRKNNTLTLEQKKELIKIRRNFFNPVIGVTGSLGKSTLIEMMSVVLSTKGKVLRTPVGKGSWERNYKTLKRLNESFAFAIFEFDYQAGRNFANILRFIKPSYALVTNIGDAHLVYLKEAMRVALQKSEVLKYLVRDGSAILNLDDELASSLSNYFPVPNVYKFGLNQTADLFASDIKQLGPKGISFKINNDTECNLPLYSLSDVYTFLGCALTCMRLGFTLDEIIGSIKSKFHFPKGRGRVEKIKNYYLIDESYQGSSRSVSKASRALVGFKPFVSKTVFIVGDMNEYGEKVEERHLNMGYFLSALSIDYLITLGHYADFIGRGASLIKTGSRKVISVKNVDELIKTLKSILMPDMAISVKGLGNVVFHKIKMLLEKNKP
jgi:UDP-N-acetylmuramoyl-tripeptide--D-alanyl-D-alanine ligase